ncbi:MAG: antibiotic biosynthesis monooxygenase [Caldilinea sp. CFX5]|nr:antibiotic biosynthesis monooxygenase [Caldilinea sp. CFX5]
MYSVLAHVTIQPQHVDEFITLHRELAGEYLRDEPGTLGFDVIQDEKAVNHFYFHETYVDEAAFQAHMHGAIAQRNFPRILALLAGPVDDSLFLGKGFNITPVER